MLDCRMVKSLCTHLSHSRPVIIAASSWEINGLVVGGPRTTCRITRRITTGCRAAEHEARICNTRNPGEACYGIIAYFDTVVRGARHILNAFPFRSSSPEVVLHWAWLDKQGFYQEEFLDLPQYIPHHESFRDRRYNTPTWF